MVNDFYWDELEKFVDEEIDKVYQARRAKRKKRDWFSASNAGFCKRATILNRLNAKEGEHDAKTKRIFWIGNLIHEGTIALLKKAGKVVADEEFVGSKFDGSDLVGAFDVIVKMSDGKNCLYELKSKNTGAFWTSIVRTGKPSLHNIYQAVTYYLLNKKHKVDSLTVTYISKDDAAMRSFIIDLTPELIAEVQAWWQEVREAFAKKELPPPYPETSWEFKGFCKNCTFNAHWCFGDKEQIKENLVQLQW